jgi:hypothetical protein
MQINASYMGLYGGAQVGISADGQILGSTTSASDLTVHDGTIFGGGYIGNGTNAPARDGLTLVVSALGTINASGVAHAMVLETGANAINNGGLIETTTAGGLTIDSQMHRNGRLVAAGTGALTINGVDVGDWETSQRATSGRSYCTTDRCRPAASSTSVRRRRWAAR